PIRCVASWMKSSFPSPGSASRWGTGRTGVPTPPPGPSEHRWLRRLLAKAAAMAYCCQFSYHMIFSLSHRGGRGNEPRNALSSRIGSGSGRMPPGGLPVPAAAAEGLAAEGQAAASRPRQRQLGPHRLRAASPPKGRACAKKEEMAVPMDGLAFAALVHTLHTGWTGGLVSRITQPEPAYIVFHLRHRRENASLHCLLDQNEPVLWAARGDDSDDPAFAANDQRPGAHPSPFCMLLRKHLEGARLVAVRQTGWYRLLQLDFQVASHLPHGRAW